MLLSGVVYVRILKAEDMEHLRSIDPDVRAIV